MAFADLSSTPWTTSDRNTTNWASWTFTTTVTINAGDVVVCLLVTDNITATSGVTSDHTSVDAGGQAFTKAHEETIGGGAAAGGVTTSVWYLEAASTITSGATVTVSLAGAAPGNGAKVSVARRFSKGAGTVLTVQSVTQVATSGADVPDLQLSALPSREYLFIEGIGFEGSSVTAMTPTASWTALAGTQTAAGGAATNVGGRWQSRILTGTATGANNPTSGGGAVDHSAVLVAIYEAAGATQVAGSESFALSEGTTVVAIDAARTDAVAASDPTPAVAITAAVTDSEAFSTETSSVVAQNDKAGSESFSLADGVTALAATLATSDTPGVLDSSTALGLLVGDDSVVVAEIAGVAASLSAAEAHSLSVELSALAQAFVGSESFSFSAETATLANTLSAVDAWALTDVRTLSSLFASSESFTLAELAALAVTLAVVEGHLLIEAADAGGNTFLNVVDAASLTDASSLTQNVLFAAADAASLLEQAGLTESRNLAANDAALASETLALASATLAVDDQAASEVAAIAALLAAGIDDALLTDEAFKTEGGFVEIIAAVVTAAVTLQGMTQTTRDDPSGVSSATQHVTGSASAETD